MNIILIFFGAGLGGVLRYGISNSVHLYLSRQFPYGTLTVNASGSFFMGLLFALVLTKFNTHEAQFRALLIIGFLGGYTTFSAFSIETLSLIENGEWCGAMINIFVSVILCVSLTALGLYTGRQL